MTYNPDMRALAMRDPAMAALMGIMPGADYGVEPQAPHGADFGYHHYHGNPSGVSPYDISANIGYDGTHFGYAFGTDPSTGMVAPVPAVGAPAVHPSVHAHPAHTAMALHGHAPPPHAGAHPAHVAAWHAVSRQVAATQRRASLLAPNQESTVQVERYSFTIPQALVLNTPLTGINTTLQPNTMIRPQRVVMNAPAANFVLLTALFVANVNVFVGGIEDAWTYSVGAMGVMLDMPTLSPANRATFSGNYSGLVPPGYSIGFAFTFTVTLQGPATIAGSVMV